MSSKYPHGNPGLPGIAGITLPNAPTFGSIPYPSPLAGPNRPLPQREGEHHDEMSAVDFVLWLNGAFDVLDSTPPNQAQWDKMRNQIAEQVGKIVASRIRKAAQPYEDSSMAKAQVQQAAMSGASYAASIAQYQQAIQVKKLEMEAQISQMQAKNAQFGTLASSLGKLTREGDEK